MGIRAIEYVLKPVFHKEIINRYAGEYKEDPLFVTSLIKVESNFLRRAKSRKGALGLMQIMPKTAQETAKELQVKSYDLKDPETNIRFGIHHLSKLKREFGNDPVTILGAYNAGSKNVREWLKEKNKRNLEIQDIEFLETRNFVENVLSTYEWLKRIQKWRNRIIRLKT